MGYPCPDVIIDGEVLEADPPRLLKTTWRFNMDPAAAAEGFTTLTYEIRPVEGGYCALTLTHECDGAPTVALMIANQLGDGDEHRPAAVTPMFVAYLRRRYPVYDFTYADNTIPQAAQGTSKRAAPKSFSG